MKHQFFLFLSLHFFSAYAMQPEQNNITKNQLIGGLSALNSYIKRNCPDEFDAKKFGWFIVGLREMPMDEFESKREELLNMLKPVDSFEHKELG